MNKVKNSWHNNVIKKLRNIRNKYNNLKRQYNKSSKDIKNNNKRYKQTIESYLKNYKHKNKKPKKYQLLRTISKKILNKCQYR